MRKKKNTNQGITLIALVITIIILLILVGISIASLTGENGLLNKATVSKTKTEKATAEEKVKLAVMGSYGNDGKLDYKELKDNLDKVEGIINLPNHIESLPLEVNVDGYNITIGNNGNITNNGSSSISNQIIKDYRENLLYEANFNNLVNGNNEGITVENAENIKIDKTNTYATFDGTSSITIEGNKVDPTNLLLGTSSKTITCWYRTNKTDMVPIIIRRRKQWKKLFYTSFKLWHQCWSS